jgi:sigma-B regulation protein RsbQ
MTDMLSRHAVQITGQGPRTLLFANGFGCDQNVWRQVAPAFEADDRVIRFDYAGSGGADPAAYDSERHAALAGYAQDVIDVAGALDLRDATFVGHSVGAMIGVLAALAAPGVFDELVLVGPSPRYVDDPPDYTGGFSAEEIEGLLALMERNYIGWAQALAPTIMKNEERPELGGELERSFCATDPVIARRFANATFRADNRADIARLDLPTLVLQCADDAIAPDAVGQWMAGQLRHGTLRGMRATGHCPHMSHPDETIALIRDWLDARRGG